MWLMYIVFDPVICYAILTTATTSGGANVTHAYPEITSLVLQSSPKSILYLKSVRIA